MHHALVCSIFQSMGFVSDQSHNHAVQIEEEHEEVEAELYERFLQSKLVST